MSGAIACAAVTAAVVNSATHSQGAAVPVDPVLAIIAAAAALRLAYTTAAGSWPLVLANALTFLLSAFVTLLELPR